jgi:hypothetical protein
MTKLDSNGDLIDELIGPNPLVTAMAMMMGARHNGRSSILHAIRAIENVSSSKNP